MNQQVLEVGAQLLTTEKIEALDDQQRAAVYQYVEKGKQDSGFMASLKEQVRASGILSERQLLKAASIMKGAFKHYLEDKGLVVQYTEDGSPTLAAAEPVAEPPKKPARRRAKAA